MNQVLTTHKIYAHFMGAPVAPEPPMEICVDPYSAVIDVVDSLSA